MALEAADGFTARVALAAPPPHTVLGLSVPSKAGDRDRVERRVHLRVTAAAEPVSMAAAARCLGGDDAAERGERGPAGQRRAGSCRC
ncbi:hypothetical protein Ae505Ps2_0312 [Pseudonocardia sp. Ae505_Ps2]|nr:hypothetical protein Ae505Ps2_0312 [Pseudonocardia sp. Ae505_Ps2]